MEIPKLSYEQFETLLGKVSLFCSEITTEHKNGKWKCTLRVDTNTPNTSLAFKKKSYGPVVIHGTSPDEVFEKLKKELMENDLHVLYQSSKVLHVISWNKQRSCFVKKDAIEETVAS